MAKKHTNKFTRPIMSSAKTLDDRFGELQREGVFVESLNDGEDVRMPYTPIEIGELILNGNFHVYDNSLEVWDTSSQNDYFDAYLIVDNRFETGYFRYILSKELSPEK